MDWQTVGWIAAFVLACVGVLAVSSIRRALALTARLKQSWGQWPQANRQDSAASLEEANAVSAQLYPGHSQIDALTWHDLNMQAVFERLNQTESSVGSEALYARLHQFDFHQVNVAEPLIAFFTQDSAARLAVRRAFAHLGKSDHNQSLQYLLDADHYQLPHPWRYTLLGWLPVVGLGLCALWPLAGIVTVMASLFVNVTVFVRKKARLEVELDAMRYLVQTIFTAKRLIKIQTPSQKALAQAYAPLAKLTRHAFVFRAKTGSDGDVLADYLGIILMLPFRQYNSALRLLHQQREAALQLWQGLGDLEVALAVANFRLVAPITCQPDWTDSAVTARGLVHPLLAEPVANDVDWQQTALITGANASGKSTYVKSVAINCILAQTINTCTAAAFALAPGHVVSAMAVADDLAVGDSYFVAEIKAIRRVLTLVAQGQRVYGFIDEILKGTNTVERIAASASVVRWLQDTQARCMVATHDSELTGILGATVVNWHFQETVDDAGVHFDYRLHQGPATSHNAIALLAALDYPPAVTQAAQALAQGFEATHAWPQAT